MSESRRAESEKAEKMEVFPRVSRGVVFPRAKSFTQLTSTLMMCICGTLFVLIRNSFYILVKSTDRLRAPGTLGSYIIRAVMCLARRTHDCRWSNSGNFVAGCLLLAPIEALRSHSHGLSLTSHVHRAVQISGKAVQLNQERHLACLACIISTSSMTVSVRDSARGVPGRASAQLIVIN